MNGLALREKRLLAGTAAGLLALLLWLLLIQPPLRKIEYWQAETPKLRSQAEALEVLLHEVAPGAGDSAGGALSSPCARPWTRPA